MSTKVTSPNSYTRISTISPGTPKPLFQKKEVTYSTSCTYVSSSSRAVGRPKEGRRKGGGRDRMPSFNAHTTFRYPEDKKDLVEKARKMAGSKGLNGLQLELLEEFVVRQEGTTKHNPLGLKYESEPILKASEVVTAFLAIPPKELDKLLPERCLEDLARIEGIGMSARKIWNDKKNPVKRKLSGLEQIAESLK